MNSDTPYKDDTVIERLKQDVGEEVLPMLEQAFKGEIETSADTLKRSLAASDLALFETTAHALKSAAASFGAMQLSDICRELEMSAKDNASEDRLTLLLKNFGAVVKQTNKAFGF
ncbi:MAG: Hpt domain-containing protein [Kordiimonadaceae bacterium]|nr:Hpt domain-containing protein [Kordiimonadaceae bacterium]MBO6568802.1 Hpt domain-containing protein [Kordiimonadaceae bacterium]MBO6965223.1 Hpt domain-containing protein [Kordiimonadaceae bacterium]